MIPTPMAADSEGPMRGEGHGFRRALATLIGVVGSTMTLANRTGPLLRRLAVTPQQRQGQLDRLRHRGRERVMALRCPVW
jgi:hypothetical protein